MKNVKLISALALVALWGGVTSCSNEFDEAYHNQAAGKGSVFHAPDIYAWSGDQTLGNPTRGTRANEDPYVVDTPDYYDWCDNTWWPDNVPTTCPEPSADAIVVTPSNYYNITLEEGKTYKFTGDVAYGGFNLEDIPANVTIFVQGSWNLFDCRADQGLNEDEYPTVYVCKGGYLNIGPNDGERALISDLKIVNYGSTHIQVNANTIGEGCLIYDASTEEELGSLDEKLASLEFEQNEQYYDENGKPGDWTLIIKQPIYSRGYVYFRGDVSLGANSYFRKVCVDGDLTIAEGTTVKTGYLNADQINCEAGARNVMAPQGLAVIGTYNMAEGSLVRTEGAEKLGSILTNDILGDNKEDMTGQKDYGFKYLNEENFGTLFQDVNIYVTKTINNSQDEGVIESHKPGGKGETVALMEEEEFDASAQDVNGYDCGKGYEYLPKVTDKPEEGEKCDKCDHPKHEGEPCDECKEGEGCYPSNQNPDKGNPEEDGPETPEVPVDDVLQHNNEVEVNLSIADEGSYEGVRSKLSIHVRKGTDVEVFIPVPFYCENDDFMIVQTHKDMKEVYNEEYVIEGDNDQSWTVTLTVEMDVNKGITVTTDGITQELIDYLMKKNGDGINFEVWNYFPTEYVDKESGDIKHSDVTRDALKESLDRATIEFLDEEPDYYINAFAQDEDGHINEWDCTVSIYKDQKADYEQKHTGHHLNGSEYNEIYVRNGVTPDHFHAGK